MVTEQVEKNRRLKKIRADCQVLATAIPRSMPNLEKRMARDDVPWLLEEVAAIAARLVEADAKLANVKTAADDALDELVKCPDYETAMVVASTLCGTLQFISGYTALAAALAPGVPDA